MMTAHWNWIGERLQSGTPPLSTEEQLILVRRDLEELERRVSFIEATIDAIRVADDDQEAAAP